MLKNCFNPQIEENLCLGFWVIGTVLRSSKVRSLQQEVGHKLVSGRRLISGEWLGAVHGASLWCRPHPPLTAKADPREQSTSCPHVANPQPWVPVFSYCKAHPGPCPWPGLCRRAWWFCVWALDQANCAAQLCPHHWCGLCWR